MSRAEASDVDATQRRAVKLFRSQTAVSSAQPIFLSNQVMSCLITFLQDKISKQSNFNDFPRRLPRTVDLSRRL